MGTSGNTSEDHFFSKADSESQSVSMLELTQKALPNIGISWIEIAKYENAKKMFCDQAPEYVVHPVYFELKFTRCIMFNPD